MTSETKNGKILAIVELNEIGRAEADPVEANAFMTSSTLAAVPGFGGRFRNLVHRRLGLMAAYWFGLLALVAIVLFTAHPQYAESAIGAALIIVAAWVPAWLWIKKGGAGLPVFPVFALTYTWTFGLPLLYEHPIVKIFDGIDQLYAAISVTGFLVLSTVVWLVVRDVRVRPPKFCLSMRESGADDVFFIILVVAILFTISVNGAWLNIPSGVYSIIRAVVLSVDALACFVLSYRLGTGELTGLKGITFKILLLVLVLVSLPPLEMISSMAIVALSAIGYISGSGKVPWISFIMTILLFAFLHIGKGEMRDRYWAEADQGPVQPAAYPAFFAEWVSASIDELRAPESDIDEEKHSLIERASLMQLLLYERTLSGSVPFMYGETYAVVPELLIPRILYPENPTTHEGTYRLNIHYGFQTREQTETTTIGFGLLNEAYANFGLVGMAILAIVSGSFYGWVERWAEAAPLLSFRGLFAIIVASYSFQTEFAAGVYAAALFQALVALVALSMFVVRKNLNPLALASVNVTK